MGVGTPVVARKRHARHVAGSPILAEIVNRVEDLRH